jgi:hypothetical protein
MLFIRSLGVLAMILASLSLFAQGPPIRTDKPIMLGENKGTARAFYQYFTNGTTHYHVVPLMIDYNLKNNLEFGIEAPFAALSSESRQEGFRTGDLMLKAKYQFIRKDGMGKTFRVAAKASSMMPTGRDNEAPTVGMGTFMTSAGLLAGMESLKYGVVGELSYNAMHTMHPDFLEAKLAFGLPLMKPAYPVKQVTLYFEYEGKWMPGIDAYAAYFAQGIQYAFRSYALELSLQMPLVQQVPDFFRRDIALMIGGRFVI